MGDLAMAGGELAEVVAVASAASATAYVASRASGAEGLFWFIVSACCVGLLIEMAKEER